MVLLYFCQYIDGTNFNWAAFHLSPAEIAVTLRTSFIFIGIACFLQGVIGHRFSLMEGHSGVWWGLILSLCSAAATSGTDLMRVAAL